MRLETLGAVVMVLAVLLGVGVVIAAAFVLGIAEGH